MRSIPSVPESARALHACQGFRGDVTLVISTFFVYGMAVQARWLTAAVKPEQFPSPVAPEFAFLGRSNVGKSTLLNALAGARVARTSKTPGRTQTLHFYEVKSGEGVLRLTDLPGYGYAKVPAEVSRSIERMVLRYFGSGRASVLLLLLDVRREPDEADAAAVEVARSGPATVPVWVVGTKADKLSKAQRVPIRARLARALDLPQECVVLTSGLRRDGVQALRERMWAFGREAP
jgi:GTP-binding protein